MIFDTHAHLDDKQFDSDRDDVIQRMAEANVTRCVCVGADKATSHAAVELANKHEGFFAAVGVHPNEADKYSASDLVWIRGLCENKKVVAIGEIGLDYHYDDGPKTDQQSVCLNEQLDLAEELKRTVVLHVRDAHGDMINLLRQRAAKLSNIILHCYSGSLESAKIYLNLGCYLSFAGSLTFKNARNLHEVAAYVPDDRLLIETDCPYLAPMPHRGKRNEPSLIANTLRFAADLRSVPEDRLAVQTFENAYRAFGIKTDRESV